MQDYQIPSANHHRPLHQSLKCHTKLSTPAKLATAALRCLYPAMSSSESLEMEPLTEKHRSLKSSFSDSESEDDIVVHGDDGPSNEDRQLLNEEEEREKLLTKRRKILIGSKKDHGRRSSSRRKSIESYMEDGTLDTPRRSTTKVSNPSEMSGLIGLETTMFY